MARSGRGKSTKTDKAQAAAGQAQEKAKETASGAKDKAQEVASQAQDSAREAAGQARGRVRDQVDQRSTDIGDQVKSSAGDVRSVADELRKQGKDTPAKYVEQAADRAERLGGYLENSDGDRILSDVEDFGRRNPWAVAAGGLLLGFAASRVLKASSSQRYRSSKGDFANRGQYRSATLSERSVGGSYGDQGGGQKSAELAGPRAGASARATAPARVSSNPTVRREYPRSE